MPGIFIVYEKVSETAGRILSTTSVGDDASHAAMLTERGVLFEYIPLDGGSGYVKIEGDRTDFAIRPDLPAQWQKTVLAPVETTTLPDVPPGTIQVYGPISGMTPHEGGDLKLGFVLPGHYQVTLSCFPYKDYTTTFVVDIPETGETPDE